MPSVSVGKAAPKEIKYVDEMLVADTSPSSLIYYFFPFIYYLKMTSPHPLSHTEVTRP